MTEIQKKKTEEKEKAVKIKIPDTMKKQREEKVEKKKKLEEELWN